MINSCDAFSDLWDPHIKLLNTNWSDRNISTYLVSDLPTNKSYMGVTVLCAGKKKELSERIRYALSFINTEYILLTLDDYFLTKKISSRKIDDLINIMDQKGLDYVRLFKHPNSFNKIKGTNSLYWINLDSKHDSHYQINLYAGLWRKEFLEKCVESNSNAWELELNLTPIGRENNAKCALSKGNEFPILDVVRKGKLLHKAYYFLKLNKLYEGDREVIPWKEEIKLNCMKFIKIVSTQRMIDFYKTILRRQGYHFYSDDIQEK